LRKYKELRIGIHISSPSRKHIKITQTTSKSKITNCNYSPSFRGPLIIPDKSNKQQHEKDRVQD